MLTFIFDGHEATSNGSQEEETTTKAEPRLLHLTTLKSLRVLAGRAYVKASVGLLKGHRAFGAAHVGQYLVDTLYQTSMKDKHRFG